MENYVRRDDLRLRSRYPSLKTKIFEIEAERFLIYVQNPFDDRDALCEEFNNSIRFITSPVKLTFKLPEKFIKEIPVIADSEIGDNFAGIGWTVNQFYNLLYSKFPFLKSIIIDSVENGVVKIHFTKGLSGLYNSQLTSFLESISGNCIKFKALFDGSGQESFKVSSETNHVLTILPTRWNKKKIEYEERDEAFWFDNVKGIYQGSITKENILGQRSQKNSCYIKYSQFSNVNIRNGLLLFDHVYVELPIDTNIDVFCKQQQIYEDDLFSLVLQGRITFVTNQPYDRIDSDFLNNIYKIKPEAVLSRRALSALILADLVEINKKYLITDEIMSFLTPDMFKSVLPSVIDAKTVYNIITWPRQAIRKSLNVLMLNSSANISSLGINNCIEIPQNHPNHDALEFEFVIHSEFVHIASALNSFYFPFWGDKYETKAQSSVMYNMLNFFKCQSEADVNQFNSRVNTLLNGESHLSALDLLDVNIFPPVEDILQFSETYCASKNFSSLFSYLDSFPNDARNQKILEYNKLLQNLKLKRNDFAKSMDLGFSFFTDLPGIPFLGTIVNLAKLGIGKFFEKNDVFQSKWNEFKNKINPEKPMDKQITRFLSQISPVARLKTFDK